ncbi:CatB-related O-acetyltransferase [Olleya sp. Bg11-27]|uniref:CatB-related O-acetyltransferase n=1 Tax=Olleya sp. Bg11-27 TaxID=2058135 RepID=UPI0012FE6A0C|nr:CatB-related O-acetyltransferase [Olleya sp. Bg11-27]
MYKTLKYIYHKFENFVVRNKTIELDRPVNLVLILHDGFIDVDLKKALLSLEDDFSFTKLDVSSQSFDTDLVNTFDFVLVNSTFDGRPHKLFKTIKKVKPLVGIYLKGNNLPKSTTDYKRYDLLWFESYEFSDIINVNIPKIHALGIDVNSEIGQYKINTAKHILMCRYRNLPYPKTVASDLKEFYKSPIWDTNYLSNQLRKGFNYFKKDIKRRTNYIESSKKVKAGRHSFFNQNLLITGDEYVEIGSFCSFGKNISIYTSNHDINYASTQGYIYRKYFNKNHPGENLYNPSIARTKGPVKIKNDVWIGDGVKIMSGVTIGNGVCIAAGSIVTTDVEDYSVVAGIPAKFIKKRFNNQELIDLLLDLKWWEWSDRKIMRNEAFFSLNFNELTKSMISEIKIN